jgi:hypothetical protein
MAHSVHFGGKKILKNVEYLGAEFLGTGMQLTEDVNININGTVFTSFNKDEEIYKVDTHTYTFEEDTVIKSIYLEDPNYSQEYSNTSNVDVALVAGVESANIVLLENTEEAITPITRGQITVFYRVEHTGGGSNTISTQIYKSGVAYGDPFVDVLSQGATEEILHIAPVIEAFAVTDNVSFKVTATATATILGTEIPSLMKIKRENI